MAEEWAGERPWIEPLRFRSRPMVRWFTPREIIRSGYEEFIGRRSGIDNRDVQAALRVPVVHHAPALTDALASADATTAPGLINDPLPFHRTTGHLTAGETVTVDYVADIGDGFSSTFTVARQLAEPAPVDDGSGGPPEALERADMIVLGGDAVYPAADPEDYRNRTIGPYRTAFEALRATNSRIPLFAIPGNHDWYDGLSAFLERFTVFQAGADDDRHRGWRLHQTRSYFAVQLTGRWWLWGIDIALRADIDTPQMQYFRQVAAIMPDDARVVLCTAKPAWFRRGRRGGPWSAGHRGMAADPSTAPDDWDRLTYFLDRTLGPAAPDVVRLVLTGDQHYYARHEPVEEPTRPTMVVAGGGGAYLASTLEGPRDLDLPWHFHRREETAYSVAAEWPSRPTSRRLGLRGLYLVPWRNRELGAVFGLVYSLFGLAARSGAVEARSATGDAGELSNPEPFVGDAFLSSQVEVAWGAAHHIGAWALAALVVLALVAMAKAHRRPWSVALPAAAVHAGLHGTAVTATAVVAARATSRLGSDSTMLDVPVTEWLFATWPAAGFTLLTGVIGAGAGLMAFALYLVSMQFARVNLNELFAGMRLPHYRHHLRLEVGPDAITGRVIGFEQVDDLELHWMDGSPTVSGSRSEPKVVDRFVVRADPAGIEPETPGPVSPARSGLSRPVPPGPVPPGPVSRPPGDRPEWSPRPDSVA